MALYEMKYMYDFGSGICLWSTNQAAIDRYDYPVDVNELPISEALKQELDALVEKHDEALNWNDPGSDLLWNEEQIAEFTQQAINAYHKICSELPDLYQIELCKDCLI